MSPDVVAVGPIALRTQENHKAIRSISLAVLVCWLATVVLGLFSDGVHHDDDLVHFLMARWSWWYPGYLLHVWGRSGLTVPMAGVVWMGDVETAWHAARILSSVVSAAAAFVASRLAHNVGIERPWRVVLACYLQPLFTVLGYTTLTENFTAFYLIAAVALLDRGRSLAASVIFSLALLTRHEAVMFIPIWCAALFWRRDSLRNWLYSSAASIWAPVAHNVLFRITFGDWPVRIFLQPRGSTQYLPTGWGAYVPDALYALSPAIFVFCIVGGAYFFAATVRSGLTSSRANVATRGLIIVIPAAFLFVHAFITAVGVYGSGGFGRFMVAIAPFVAILSVKGFDRLRSADKLMPMSGYKWGLVAACWVVIWAALESELAAGRLPVSDAILLNTGRVLLFCLLIISTSGFGLLNRSPRTCNVFLISMLVLTGLQAAFMCRPLALHQKQKAVALLIRQLTKAGLDNRPIFAADAWFAYGLGVVENPRAMKDAKLLASMPVGMILIWDSTYSGSDYHGLSLAEIESNTAYYERTGEVTNTASDTAFRVFEKVKPTPIPQKVRPSYPPPMDDGGPPIRGVFYLRDSSRPNAFLGSP